MTFGEKLKFLRKQKNITQVELAAAINVSFAIIGQIESGARNPSKEVAKKLSDYFNVALDVFIIESAPVNFTHSDTKQISTADVLMIADIVSEYLVKNGFKITPEQRVALIDRFYRQNITDANKIKEMLTFMLSMDFVSKPAK